MPGSAVPGRAKLCCAGQHHAMHHGDVPCQAVPSCAVPGSAMPCITEMCHARLCRAVLCHASWRYAVPGHAELCCAGQHRAMHHGDVPCQAVPSCAVPYIMEKCHARPCRARQHRAMPHGGALGRATHPRAVPHGAVQCAAAGLHLPCCTGGGEARQLTQPPAPGAAFVRAHGRAGRAAQVGAAGRGWDGARGCGGGPGVGQVPLHGGLLAPSTTHPPHVWPGGAVVAGWAGCRLPLVP